MQLYDVDGSFMDKLVSWPEGRNYYGIQVLGVADLYHTNARFH